MNVKEIVKLWLKWYSYDGLYCDDCACELIDLMTCTERSLNEKKVFCEPGYKTNCDCNDDDEEFDPLKDKPEHKFHIGPNRNS